MSSKRKRFSRRHLLALCTFLAPLALLAVLGRGELQRQGDRLAASLSSEAKLFLDGAAQAFEQQFDRQLPPLLDESRRRLAEFGALQTTRKLREQYAALLDILVVDELGDLVWPQPPRSELGLPFAQPTPFHRSTVSDGMQAVDLMLTAGRYEDAERMLLHLTRTMEQADDSGRGLEVQVHFRLATVQKKLGRTEAARKSFERVRELAFPANSPQWWRFHDDYGAMAETALAEMGTVDDRIVLFDRLAHDRHYRDLPEGLRAALIERLRAGVPPEHPEFARVEELLQLGRQRARTRTFAGDYEVFLIGEVRNQQRQYARAGVDPDDLEIVATLGDATTMLWLRKATEAEKQRYRGASRIGLHIDLDLLMAPALEPYVQGDGSLVLAVHDPRGIPVKAPPEETPEGFVAPQRVVHGIRLSAWPANASRLIAESDAQARIHLLLVLALFGAAMAGALWLWRSVSREAELAALKVDLVSRVSHELKTPLALIRMYGETLELGRARDSDQARHFGGIIARESERLTTMIQRILDFSRQQAGTLTYARTEVDLGELLHRICDAYTPHLEGRGAVLVDLVRASAHVLCDETACESAVINLLENAAKYAGDGDAHAIEVDLVVDGEHATIEVRDRGRGIPNGEFEHVFDAFFRASNSGQVRGAGIGLSLVRHFARAHGGEVSARARDGGGAVFSLTLPLAGRSNGSGGGDQTP